MNANIVLSVKGRKVLFKPLDYFKWVISLPIERIEVKCENSHHFECIGYVPTAYQKVMYVTVKSDKWYLPKCDKVVIPIINSGVVVNQLIDTLFNDCHCTIDFPEMKIKRYINDMRR